MFPLGLDTIPLASRGCWLISPDLFRLTPMMHMVIENLCCHQSFTLISQVSSVVFPFYCILSEKIGKP